MIGNRNFAVYWPISTMKRTPLKRKTPLKRSQKPMKRTVKRRNSVKSISALKKQADAVFSLFIRTRDGGKCYTCEVVKPIKEMQNGHYITRGCNQLRYDTRNCHCQCVGCNIFKSGNMPAYSLALIRQYGPNILTELEAEHRKIKQFTRDDLQDIINRYAT